MTLIEKPPEKRTGRRRLTISAGLSLAFGAILGLTLLTSVTAWLLYDQLALDLKIMSSDVMPRVVRSRNLVMANNSLATVASKMAMATTADELRSLRKFVDIASSRVRKNLLDAEVSLTEPGQMAVLQQLHMQIDQKLVQLNRQVLKNFDQQKRILERKKAFRAAGEQAALQITAQMRQRLGQAHRKKHLEEEGFYLDAINMIRNAERTVHSLNLFRSQSDLDVAKRVFQKLVEKFAVIVRRLQHKAVGSDLACYHETLSSVGWGPTSLFEQQQELLDTEAAIETLLNSSNQLSAQFRLMTTVIVNRSTEQVEQLRETALENIVQRKKMIVSLVVGGFGLSILLIWYFGHRRMARPLGGLSLAVSALERGEKIVEAPPGGVGEIQDLALAFNRMAGTIAARDRELRHLQLLLRNVIDSLPPVLMAVDQKCQLMLWNLQAEKYCATENLIIGKSLAEVLSWLPYDPQRLQQAVDAGQPLQVKRLRVEREGLQRTFELSANPLIDAVAPGAVLRIEDVTDRIRIEKTIAQAEKMMSVGGLAAGIAHEINNPLAGILQSIQVVDNRFRTELPPNIKVAKQVGTDVETIHAYLQERGIFRMLEGIRSSAIQAAQIVKNLLAFSRTGSGVEGSSFELYNLSVLVDTTVELLESDYDLKHGYDFRQICVERNYAEDLPTLCCEGSLIQQVVFNVLKNSAQALYGMEEPRDKPCICLSIRCMDEMMLLEIEDNGPGMSPQVRERIFEPFYTTKTVGMGTGLGMSISYFIITEYHQGTIEVASKPGQGSKFSIKLPLEKTAC